MRKVVDASVFFVSIAMFFFAIGIMVYWARADYLADYARNEGTYSAYKKLENVRTLDAVYYSALIGYGQARINPIIEESTRVDLVKKSVNDWNRLRDYRGYRNVKDYNRIIPEEVK